MAEAEQPVETPAAAEEPEKTEEEVEKKEEETPKEEDKKEEEEKEKEEEEEEKPLPKGVGRVPKWWMECTPHNVLIVHDEEARRHAKNEEAMMLAQKAAEKDLLEKWGGEGFPNWNPNTDGPRTPGEEKEWISKGYKRAEDKDNQWVDEKGEPLEGRQFRSTMPSGYVPGAYGPGGYYDPTKFGGTPLKSTGGGGGYAREQGNDWEKPDWMKVKLKSTGAGGKIRQGDYTESEGAPTGKAVKRVLRKRVSVRKLGEGEENETVEETLDEEGKVVDAKVGEGDEIVEEKIIEEVVMEDEHGNETIEKRESTAQNLTELQKILQRRAKMSEE